MNGSDGGVKDLTTGRSYPYLFWEATRKNAMPMDYSESWSVPNTRSALKTMLTTELTRRAMVAHEIKDFLEYWLEELEKQKTRFVSIAFVDISKDAPLTVTSANKADKSPVYVRVFAQFSASDEQVGKPYEPALLPETANSRAGPTAEWGVLLEPVL